MSECVLCNVRDALAYGSSSGDEDHGGVQENTAAWYASLTRIREFSVFDAKNCRFVRDEILRGPRLETRTMGFDTL